MNSIGGKMKVCQSKMLIKFLKMISVPQLVWIWVTYSMLVLLPEHQICMATQKKQNKLNQEYIIIITAV